MGKSCFTIKRRPCHSSVHHSHHNIIVGAKELVQMSQGNEQLPRIPRTRCPKQTIIDAMYPMTCHSEGLFMGRNTQNLSHGQWKIQHTFCCEHVEMSSCPQIQRPGRLFDLPSKGMWPLEVSLCQISGRNCGNPIRILKSHLSFKRSNCLQRHAFVFRVPERVATQP